MTDKDLAMTHADPSRETKEGSEEKSLQWLLDMDLSEPEEKLFKVELDDYSDRGLSAFEAEVASRPMFRGKAGADDLSTYVAEEIVISSESQSSDIYSGSAAQDGAAAQPEGVHDAADELMALDFSARGDRPAGVAANELEDGTDILGQLDDSAARAPETASAQPEQTAKAAPAVVEVAAGSHEPSVVEAVQADEPVTAETPVAVEPVCEQEAPEVEAVAAIEPTAELDTAEAADPVTLDPIDFVAACPEEDDDEAFDQYLLGGDAVLDADPDFDSLSIEAADEEMAVGFADDLAIDLPGEIDSAADFAAEVDASPVAEESAPTVDAEAPMAEMETTAQETGELQIFGDDLFADDIPAAGFDAAAADADIDALFDDIGDVSGGFDNEVLDTVVEQPMAVDAVEPEAVELEVTADVEIQPEVAEAEDDNQIAAEMAEEEVAEAQQAAPADDTPSDLAWAIPEGITFNYTSCSGAEIFADFLDAFLEEGSVELEKLEEAVSAWEEDIESEQAYATVTRTLHTMKGIAKGVGLQFYGTLIHNFETLLEALPRPAADGERDYFRIVNVWLDAAVRGLDHVRDSGQDIASEFPQVAGQVVAPAAADAMDGPGDANQSPAERAPTAEPNVGAHSVGDSIDDDDIVGAHSVGDSIDDEHQSPGTPDRAERAPTAEPNVGAHSVGDEIAEGNVSSPAPQKAPSTPTTERRQRDRKLADEGARALAAQQTVRITPERLDHMLNLANQSQQLGVRTAQSSATSKRALAELQARLQSVRSHIAGIADRSLLSVSGGTRTPGAGELDALEMDQYSELQEAANILREGIEDIADLVDLAGRHGNQVEALLQQQSAVIGSLGSSIRAARVVPVSRLMPGLRRLVRTVSNDLGKNVTFKVLNEVGTLDRDDYARCQIVLEHMVRNALDHGIEAPEQRREAGKPESGSITVDIRRAGANSIITLADDGKGIDPQAMRETARRKGLDVDVDALSDEEALRLVFHKGFSTARAVSEISGRGVGMDIVLSELQQMGGDIRIESTPGEGTAFHITVPSNVTVNGALLVRAGQRSYAIPLGGLVAVEHVPVTEFFDAIERGQSLQLSGLSCEPTYLASLCHGDTLPERKHWNGTVPVIVAGSAARYMAIAIDHVEEALELVIRSLGPQFAAVPGVAGAATTADGEALVALDLNLLVESAPEDDGGSLLVAQDSDDPLLVLVVDDSRTQRMVTTNQLGTLVGVETMTAENGAVAIELLNNAERLPDIVLLDVEMPVKDGIETLREIRKSVRYSHLPVIMITSRTGLKHRTLAQEAGCNGYMGKPFNFPILVGQINELTGHRLQLN
jgi:chemotaxis protein histidine kinase CheA/CheY-like chemotaxis protein